MIQKLQNREVGETGKPLTFKRPTFTCVCAQTHKPLEIHFIYLGS